jgi:hypothetical protein
MSSLSYSDVFSLSLDSAESHDITPGAVVATGQNRHPRYTVIAISGDTVWLRNVDTGADSLAPRARCRLIDLRGLAFAAE